MSADTTPTNVSLIQRNALGTNDWINLLGSANPGKSIGFNDSGVLAAINTFGIFYVKTWAQLQAALTAAGTAGSGVIYIDGTIVVPPNTFGGGSGLGGLNITTPNIVITGANNGKSVIKLQAGALYTSQIYYTINIGANNVVIENITIEGVVINWSFSGTSGQRNSIGIHLGRGVGATGMTDTYIRNVHIFNTFRAIWLSGGPTSAINRNLAIIGNKIRSSGAGIYIEYSVDGLLISENSIVGDGAVYDGSKFSSENCIWVGLGINRCRIVNNHCADHQRMGIEVFWPFRNTMTGNALGSAGQTDAGCVVANNTITNMGSMGISFAGARGSVVANNTISDVVFVGLEVVGDDRNTQTQKPDRVVNASVIGNMVKNVRATPRRKKTTPPADPWLYGYSSIALDPTNCTLPTQSFSNKVPLTTTAGFTLGSKSFVITTPKIYPEFAIGKEVLLSRTNGQYMIGTVTFNDGTTITVNVTSLSSGADGTLYSYTLCPYGLHTISVPALQLDWSGNNELQNNLTGMAALAGTGLILRNPTTALADRYMNATVVSYVPGANTAVIKIGLTGAAFEDNTSWIAIASQMIVGLSIDQIYGCKAVGNTIDIVLDSSSSTKFGCQIEFAEDITFENNVLGRAGQRYLFVNNSNRVFIRGNTFKAGTETMVRDATNFNITKLGEDTAYPENIVSTNNIAWPCSLYAIFTASSPGYNAGAAYNNCRIIFKDNSVIPTTSNALKTLTNGAAIFSDQYSRPESAFGPAVVLKNNWVGEGFTDVVNWPIPVLDYSQKWTNSAQVFTGYRFHIDTNQSAAGSRLFDIATGNDTYLYLKSYASITPNTLVLESKSFVVSTATFPSANIPVGTFVRCTSGTNFIEGRVTTYNSGTSAFSMLATYAEGTPASYASWTITFDTSALFVDKNSMLNLRSDVVFDYHTGTKLGTAAAQKLGFWGKVPVVQPAAVADAVDAPGAITQLNLLLARLRSAGVIAT
jgi:parallel beta-helix repeat protein